MEVEGEAAAQVSGLGEVGRVAATAAPEEVEVEAEAAMAEEISIVGEDYLPFSLRAL